MKISARASGEVDGGGDVGGIGGIGVSDSGCGGGGVGGIAFRVLGIDGNGGIVCGKIGRQRRCFVANSAVGDDSSWLFWPRRRSLVAAEKWQLPCKIAVSVGSPAEK